MDILKAMICAFDCIIDWGVQGQTGYSIQCLSCYIRTLYETKRLCHPYNEQELVDFSLFILIVIFIRI